MAYEKLKTVKTWNVKATFFEFAIAYILLPYVCLYLFEDTEESGASKEILRMRRCVVALNLDREGTGWYP